MTLNLLRGAKGKKQQDIALALNQLGRNVNQQQVSAWENGARTPTIQVAFDLAIAYECTVIEIIAALGFPIQEHLPKADADQKVLQA